MWYTYQLKKISIWYFLWPHNSRAAFNGPPAELEILGLWTKPLFSFISGAGGRDCCQLVNLKIGTWPSQRPRESAGTLRQWLPESESDCQSRKLSQQLGVFPIQRPPAFERTACYGPPAEQPQELENLGLGLGHFLNYQVWRGALRVAWWWLTGQDRNVTQSARLLVPYWRNFKESGIKVLALWVSDYLFLSECQGSRRANVPTTAGRRPASAPAPLRASSL